MFLYLIAIVAPFSIDRKVREWKQLMLENFGCKVAQNSPAHITLIPPFKMPELQENRLLNDIRFFADREQDFLIHLQNFAAFPPKVIYVNVAHNQFLERIKTTLEEFLTVSYPIKKESRTFHPHVTIANRDLKKQDFSAAWRLFRNEVYKASFPASAISILRHNGSIWKIAYDVNLATADML